jgi:hypothetical protein
MFPHSTLQRAVVITADAVCALECCHPFPGAVGQLVVAGLSNLGQLYLTSEGAAKTHINNAITAKARVLEAMLGE